KTVRETRGAQAQAEEVTTQAQATLPARCRELLRRTGSPRGQATVWTVAGFQTELDGQGDGCPRVGVPSRTGHGSEQIAAGGHAAGRSCCTFRCTFRHEKGPKSARKVHSVETVEV